MAKNSKMKVVFTIVESEKGDKSFFRRVGTGFVNRDDSMNIYLDALPVGGKLHIRDADEHSNKKEAA